MTIISIDQNYHYYKTASRVKTFPFQGNNVQHKIVCKSPIIGIYYKIQFSIQTIYILVLYIYLYYAMIAPFYLFF